MHNLYSKLAIIIIITFFLILGLRAPIRNWDMVAYVASAYELDGLAGNELSSATFKAIAEEIGPDNIKPYITGNFGATVFNDPISLEQQLPFYNVKIVYVELIRLLKHFGITYPRATYLISAFFASASVMVLAALFAHYGVALFWIPVVAIFSGYATLARLSTPDAIACFFALLSVYLFTIKSRLVYVMVPLLPLIRTDLVLVSFLLMAFDFGIKRSASSIAVGVLSFLVYFGLTRIAGGYGYLTLFNYTFIQIAPYPRDMMLSRNASAYLRPYYEGFLALFIHRHALLYFLAIYFAYANQWHKRAGLEFPVLVLMPCTYALLHLILFPHYELRFFVFPVSLIFAALLIMPVLKTGGSAAATEAALK